MPPIVALAVCLAFVLALFVLDHRWRPKTSIGGWLPLIWFLIIASRPVSSWFFPSAAGAGIDDYEEGSPVDRAFYQVMLFAGLLVLFSRGINWPQFLIRNKWLVLYFAYFGISVLWSDFTFVAFKRWIKDAGNVVMVLIVLSERNPTLAIEALLIRASYVLVPVSVLLIRYFPDLGRVYNRWTGIASYSGVTANKNMLGMALTALGISLLWALMRCLSRPPHRGKRLQAFVYVSLLAMIAVLLKVADSATAIVCTLLGAAILAILRYHGFRRKVGVWAAAGGFAAFLVVCWVIFGVVASGALVTNGSFLDALAPLLTALGRDPTLTGRTDIWDAVLREDINPFFGVGFYSFWLGDRVERVSAGYYYVLNEAHNGYLELYLNGGFIGLALFLMMLVSATRRSFAGIAKESGTGIHSLSLAFVAITVVYNLTEATVSRLDLIWFGLLLLTTVYTGAMKVSPGQLSKPAAGDLSRRTVNGLR